jgi:hypothetical protein
MCWLKLLVMAKKLAKLMSKGYFYLKRIYFLTQIASLAYTLLLDDLTLV